ncbi:MAG: hypothetical protein ACI88A_002337 [Paraglaciecola sp.]|jgi:hypothetical protein
MVLRHYTSIALNILIIATCIALGIYTFGVPLLFDSLSALFFLVVAFYFRRDVNIKTVCILLILESLLINAIFVISTNSYYWIVAAYLLTAMTLWQVRQDKLTRIILVFLLISVCLEIYWYVIGYEGPQIYFYFLKISIYMLVRFLLLYRPHGLNYFLNSGAAILRLDWFVYQTKAVVCLIECAMISEYLLRHTFSVQPMLMYNYYQYIMQGLSVWIIWLVLREAIKIYRKNIINV